MFISHSRIKPGRLEEFKAFTEKFCRWVDEREPRILAFNVYIDEAGEHYTSVQIHPDAESMEHHMRVLGQEIMATFEFVESDSVEIFGTPSAAVLAMMQQIKDLPKTTRPVHLGGLTRLAGT
jgi:hypothetical protein